MTCKLSQAAIAVLESLYQNARDCGEAPTVRGFMNALCDGEVLRDYFPNVPQAVIEEACDEDKIAHFLRAVHSCSPMGARYWVERDSHPEGGGMEDLRIAVVDALDSGEEDLLSVEVFKGDCGNCIVCADITLGGPTIRAVYESRWDRLTIEGSWGDSRFSIIQDNRDESPLKEALKAEAYS